MNQGGDSLPCTLPYFAPANIEEDRESSRFLLFIIVFCAVQSANQFLFKWSNEIPDRQLFIGGVFVDLQPWRTIFGPGMVVLYTACAAIALLARKRNSTARYLLLFCSVALILGHLSDACISAMQLWRDFSVWEHSGTYLSDNRAKLLFMVPGRLLSNVCIPLLLFLKIRNAPPGLLRNLFCVMAFVGTFSGLLYLRAACWFSISIAIALLLGSVAILGIQFVDTGVTTATSSYWMAD